MKKLCLTMAVAAFGLAGIVISGPAAAAGISNVYAINANGNGPAFVAEVAKIRALAAEMELPGEQRVFFAEVAGPGTGTLFVVVEYASMAEMEASTATLFATEQYQAFVAWAQGQGISVQSRSILREITPE